MKEIFSGYYKKTDEEIKKIWDNGIICFDANVLLNLYRYSDETRNELITLMRKFDSQICLPHQSALEYNRNRYEVIADQEKAYKEFVSKINQIENDLKSTSKPPFLSKKNHNALQKVFSNVNNEVEESIKKYCDYLKQDDIYDEISNVFKDKISNSFTQKELEQIYLNGEKRYEKKVPPGYEDEKTKKDERKYGDLIIWKQILELAKEKKAPIILITDERKEDWWWKIKDGRNMGPRQELVQEMKIEANVNFHMYSSERFLSYGLKYLKEQINKKAIDELKEIALTERKLISRDKARKERRLKERTIRQNSIEEDKYLEYRIIEINERIKSLHRGLDIYKRERIDNPENQDRIIDYSINLQKLNDELNELLKEKEYHEKVRYKQIYLDLGIDNDEI